MYFARLPFRWRCARRLHKFLIRKTFKLQPATSAPGDAIISRGVAGSAAPEQARNLVRKPRFDRTECEAETQRLDGHGALETKSEAQRADVQPVRRAVLEAAVGQVPPAGTNNLKNPMTFFQVAPASAHATTAREMLCLRNRSTLGSEAANGARTNAAPLVRYAPRLAIAARKMNMREANSVPVLSISKADTSC